MDNQIDSLKTRFKYSVPGSFRLVSSPSNKSGTSDVSVFSDGTDFLMSKTIRREMMGLNDKYAERLTKITTQIKGIQPMKGFDQNAPAEAVRPVFGFSSDLLSNMLDNARNNKKHIPENVIKKVLQDVSGSIRGLEQNGLYHPFVSIDNIFFLNGTFTLINPFIFDSFLKEQREIAGLGDQAATQKLKDKLLENSTQLGYTLVQLTSLVKDEEIRSDGKYKKDNLRECLKVSNSRYSQDINITIERLIKGKETISRPLFPPPQTLKVDTSPNISNVLDQDRKQQEAGGQGNSFLPSGMKQNNTGTEERGRGRDEMVHNRNDLIPEPVPQKDRPPLVPVTVVSNMTGDPLVGANQKSNISEVVAHKLNEQEIEDPVVREETEKIKKADTLITANRQFSRGKISTWAIQGGDNLESVNNTSVMDRDISKYRNDISVKYKKQVKAVTFEEQEDSDQSQEYSKKQNLQTQKKWAPTEPELPTEDKRKPSIYPHQNQSISRFIANTDGGNDSFEAINRPLTGKKTNVSGYIFKNINDQSHDYSQMNDTNFLPKGINQTMKVMNDDRLDRTENSMYDNQNASTIKYPAYDQRIDVSRIGDRLSIRHDKDTGPRHLAVEHPQQYYEDEPILERSVLQNGNEELKKLVFNDINDSFRNDMSGIDHMRGSIKSNGSLAKEILRDMHVPLNVKPAYMHTEDSSSFDIYIDPKDEPLPIYVTFSKPAAPITPSHQAQKYYTLPQPENRGTTHLSPAMHSPSNLAVPPHVYYNQPIQHQAKSTVSPPPSRITRDYAPLNPTQPQPSQSTSVASNTLRSNTLDRGLVNPGVYTNILGSNPLGRPNLKRTPSPSQSSISGGPSSQYQNQPRNQTIPTQKGQVKIWDEEDRKRTPSRSPNNPLLFQPDFLTPSSGSNQIKPVTNYQNAANWIPNGGRSPSNSEANKSSHAGAQAVSGGAGWAFNR